MISGTKLKASAVPDLQISRPDDSTSMGLLNPPTLVKVITKKELNERMKSGEKLQILNVLNPEKYALGFIKGSKKIPLNQLEARSDELNKLRPVITYCSGVECNASTLAAEMLAEKGFDVSVYEGGIKEWKMASFTVES